jgi:hypothetical protein
METMSARHPGIDERDAFILKLIEFRGQLSSSEQRILDAMAVAAFCEVPVGDVRGYAHITRADLKPHSERNPWMECYDALPVEVG